MFENRSLGVTIPIRIRPQISCQRSILSAAFTGQSSVSLNELSCLRLRPHRQLISAGLGEVESAAAREGEDRLYHFAAAGFDLAKRTF